MDKKDRDNDTANSSEKSFDFDSGFGGLFKGLNNLLEAASKLAEKGETIEKSGDIDFSSLNKIKGAKDLKGVYGIRFGTLSDGRPSVRPFGNVRKTPKGPVVETVREPMVDIFEEEKCLLIVAEMPGIAKSEIVLTLDGDILDIKAGSGERQYQKEVLLPRSGDADKMKWTYKNGILEISIND
jgi:HSP20 family protein